MRGNMTCLMIATLLCVATAAGQVPGAAPAPVAGTARAFADEACLMKCDEASDKCMEKAGGDEQKAKACDDQYTECLSKCR